MSKLTLPIRPGKYVRRDGEIVTIKELDDGGWADATDGQCYWAATGRFDSPRSSDGDNLLDLVADYIEPAKGHPHADKMSQFAEDAKETATPWDRWQDCYIDRSGNPSPWADVYEAPRWFADRQYRRKPTITPDPHAESAAEYAKDMAETDKAWERWECSSDGTRWVTLAVHSAWLAHLQYRRKEAL